jgi:quercetin dioxygenase-like cupin family protein
MSTITETRPRTSPAVETGAPTLREPRARRLIPATLMAAGATVLVAAAFLGASVLRTTPAAPAPVTTVGLTENTYQPGHSSGWHTHPGAHSVVVLEGVLTIVDEACRQLDVGAGGSWIGGRDPHLVRNDTASPARLVITFAFDQASALDHAATVPAPQGCPSR